MSTPTSTTKTGTPNSQKLQHLQLFITGVALAGLFYTLPKLPSQNRSLEKDEKVLALLIVADLHSDTC